MSDDLEAYQSAHKVADTDFAPSSIHHTIGKKPTQAAPGNHGHEMDEIKDLITAIADKIDPAELAAAIANMMENGDAAGGHLTGTYPNPFIDNSAVGTAQVSGANKDGMVNVPSMRTLGTGPLQAASGDHTHTGLYWVEATQSSNLVLNTAPQPLPGCTIPVPILPNEIYEVTCFYDFICTTIGASVALGELYVNGTKQTGDATFRGAGVNDRAMVCYTWKVVIPAVPGAGSWNFVANAELSAAGSAYTCFTPRSKIIVKRISPVA